MTKHPDQVGELRVLQSGHRRRSEPRRRARPARRSRRARGHAQAIPTTLDNSYPPDIGDRAAYEAYRGRYLANDPVCFASMNRAIARTNMTHLAKEIRWPTMVVAGRLDTVRPPAGSEQLAKKIPDARFELIEAGHFMPTQAAGPLLALLEDFLRK